MTWIVEIVEQDESVAEIPYEDESGLFALATFERASRRGVGEDGADLVPPRCVRLLYDGEHVLRWDSIVGLYPAAVGETL